MPDYKDKDKEELKRLRSTHPYYDEFEPLWRFYRAMYQGGREAIDGQIFRHSREHEQDYNDRIERASYMNFCGVTTDYYTNFIFSDTIERDGGKNEAFYQDFLADVNKKGDSIDAFMLQVSNDARMYGMIYLLVESPPKPLEVQTKQQEDDLGLRPYWVLMQPFEILDWNTDKFDKYTYVKRQAFSTEINLDTNKRQELEIYTEYTPNIIVTTTIDVTDRKKPAILDVTSSINGLGEIPIICLKYKKNKTFTDMGNSFLRDIAYLNRTILNVSSLIDEFLFRQCFNVLVKQSSGFLNLQGQTDDLIGTNNVIEYPSGTNAPSYLSPPVTPAEYLQSERDKLISQIFREAVQDIRSDLSNGEKSSGFSQSQAFARTVPFLSTWASKLEALENAAMALTMKYKTKTPWDGRVVYKTDYSVTNITDSMTHLLMLMKDLVLPSETFAKAELKRLVTELDGKLSSEDSLKVIKEIDNLDFKEWQDLVLTQGKSPTAQQKPQETPMTTKEMVQTAIKSNIGSTNKLKN